jgi:hypothetical protein
MRKINIILIVIIAGYFVSCKSGGHAEQPPTPTVSKSDSSPALKNIKELARKFTDVDPRLEQSLSSIINNYLLTKNALANNDAQEAGSKAKAIHSSLSGIDRSLFTPEQKKAYEAEEDELREDAEHIGKSKLDHQRMHFSTLSQGMYNIVRAFGSSIALYEVYCDKASNGDGAMWLSAAADNKNPYLGNTAAACFTVRSKIK